MRIVPLNIRMALDLRRAWNFGPHSGSPLLSPPHGSILSQITNVSGSHVVRKTVDQIVNNTNAPVADTELRFAAVNGGVYTVMLYTNFIDEAVPGVGLYHGIGGALLSSTQTSSIATNKTGPLGMYYNFQVSYKFTANANGDVYGVFYQGTPSAGNLVCLAGSYLIWTRIG